MKGSHNDVEMPDFTPEPYEEIDRNPFKPPKVRKCKNCGLEFFEKKWFERCPKCGGATTKS